MSMRGPGDSIFGRIVRVFAGLFRPRGQAYTEYVIILAVLLGLGVATTSVIVSFDTLDSIFGDYYSSLANYLNLPFF